MRLSLGQALVCGALAVALLDIIDAFVFFGLRGVPPATILQAIASGLLGRAAYEGGAATAVLGGALHLFISFVVVAVYLLASRWIPALRLRPFLFGPLYGLAVYAAMTFVVLPLSAADLGPRTLPAVVNGVLIHLLGVGLPSALAAWGARPEGAPDRWD